MKRPGVRIPLPPRSAPTSGPDLERAPIAPQCTRTNHQAYLNSQLGPQRTLSRLASRLVPFSAFSLTSDCRSGALTPRRGLVQHQRRAWSKLLQVRTGDAELRARVSLHWQAVRHGPFKSLQIAYCRRSIQSLYRDIKAAKTPSLPRALAY